MLISINENPTATTAELAAAATTAEDVGMVPDAAFSGRQRKAIKWVKTKGGIGTGNILLMTSSSLFRSLFPVFFHLHDVILAF